MEQLFVASLSEIIAVRITCTECKSAMDIQISHLEGAGLRCPACGRDLRRADCDRPLASLAAGLQAFRERKVMKIELVLPYPKASQNE